MLIKKVFADFFISDSLEEIEVYHDKFTSGEKCKIVGQIKGIKLEYIEGNVGPVYDVNMTINFNEGDHIVKSYGVMKYGDSHFEGEVPGLFVKVEGKKYVPQIGDEIVAKINSENNYINELFVMNGKSGNEINEFMKTLKEPYCTGNIITEEKQAPLKVQPIHNTQNYYLFGIIVFLLIIIAFGVKKLYFSK